MSVLKSSPAGKGYKVAFERTHTYFNNNQINNPLTTGKDVPNPFRCLPLLRQSFEKHQHKVTRPPIPDFIDQKRDQVQKGALLRMYV